MKKMYWRPQRMSARVLILLATVAAGSLAVVELYKTQERQPEYRMKLAAARLTRRAFHLIKQEKLRRGIPIVPQFDPSRSGIIGELITPVTTNTGHLGAKQTSVNPNFSALVVEWLRRANVQRGDVVAVGVSGSFPALNIATLVALKVLNMRALVISSAGSSQWGANHPEFMWPDMEDVLFEQHILPGRSIAASFGGIDDRALGLSKSGKELIEAAIERSGARILRAASYDDGLKQRMTLYREYASDDDIKAYINVGGGTISVGTRVGKHLFKPGLNLRAPRSPGQLDSVMLRFAQRGVPVIHLSSISRIAEQYELPPQPQTMPVVGEGVIFVHKTYNKWLVSGALLLTLVMLIALLRLDLGYRLFIGKGEDTSASSPEPMI